MPSLKANCPWEGEGRARELGHLMKRGDLPRRRVVQKGSRTPRGHRPIWGFLWIEDEGNGVKGCRGASRGRPGQEVRMSETVTQAEP